jgi:pimeloyl-ACP methyl ester carboxylesterase
LLPAPWATVRPVETIRANGVRLAADVYGEGEPVTVVGHGLTGSRHDLAPLAPFVPGTAVLFDFRGHGDSERPPVGAYSMDDFASDLLAVADEFGATRMVGVSLGGGALRMNAEGIPPAIRQVVDDPPARDPADVRGIVTPSLVIGQEGDPVHPAVVARELADLLPNAELILYRDRFALIRDIASLIEGVVRFLVS